MRTARAAALGGIGMRHGRHRRYGWLRHSARAASGGSKLPFLRGLAVGVTLSHVTGCNTAGVRRVYKAQSLPSAPNGKQAEVTVREELVTAQ